MAGLFLLKYYIPDFMAVKMENIKFCTSCGAKINSAE